MKKVTMQDIADALSLSKNTVSRALRGTSGVSNATKKLVQEYADSVGYIYKERNSINNTGLNFLLFASKFALSQVSFFGVIIDSLRVILHGVNSSLTVVEVEEGVENYKNVLPNGFSEEDISGIFLLSHLNTEFYKSVEESGTPSVAIDHHEIEVSMDSVLTQNVTGAYQLTKYLIDLGFKKIGFLGNIEFSPSYDERYTGYLNALRDSGITPDDDIIITDAEEDYGELFTNIENIEYIPEAWFCVNSGLAFILNTYFQSHDFDVPEDVSIVCFDNTEFSTRSTPAITSIATDLNEMANYAYILMNNRLNKPDRSKIEIRIIPTLFERDSVKVK